MFRAKKREDLQICEEVKKGFEDEPIQFWRLRANGVILGLSNREIGMLRLGYFNQMLYAYQERYNMMIEKKIYVLPEKRTSILDL